jgi:hypothetical protein
MRDGRLVGWGVIRPCRKGCKIGPLVADDRATAEVVLSALLAQRRWRGDLPRRSQHQPQRGRVGARPGAHASVRDCSYVYRRDPAVAAGPGLWRHHL